jgi:dGTPase
MTQPLAPYAAIDEQSRGRRFPEPPPRVRTEFQRDRDRIIHSNAFRRLVYKTQVFVNHEGDMYRTRITHSLEVAQIGRTVARALNINETLTEAICLAHDLGHTPFGHAGQDALNDCMREYGGFEHNLQSLRVIDELEERYADFAGLNLTFETREGDNALYRWRGPHVLDVVLALTVLGLALALRRTLGGVASRRCLAPSDPGGAGRRRGSVA